MNFHFPSIRNVTYMIQLQQEASCPKSWVLWDGKLMWKEHNGWHHFVSYGHPFPPKFNGRCNIHDQTTVGHVSTKTMDCMKWKTVGKRGNFSRYSFPHFHIYTTVSHVIAGLFVYFFQADHAGRQGQNRWDCLVDCNRQNFYLSSLTCTSMGSCVSLST